MAADDYAVVAGITRYPEFPPRLRGPENDAVAFKAWLTDPGGGDVPGANISLVVSSAYKAEEQAGEPEPTTVRLQGAFERLIKKGYEKDPDPIGRRLYIFLAGHGVALPDSLDDAALLMANAGRGRMGHYVPGRPVADHFRAAAWFREIVLFMDCCRDDMPKLPLWSLPWDVLRKPEAADVKYFNGFGTKFSKKSRERRLEDGDYSGLFTASLLQGLRSGETTPDRLRAFVHSHLPTIADTDRFQVPEFQANDWELELAAGAAATLPKLEVTFAQPDAAVTVVVRGNPGLMAIAEHPMADGPWTLPVRPGLYSVERSDAGGEQIVKVTEGTVRVEL